MGRGGRAHVRGRSSHGCRVRGGIDNQPTQTKPKGPLGRRNFLAYSGRVALRRILPIHEVSPSTSTSLFSRNACVDARTGFDLSRRRSQDEEMSGFHLKLRPWQSGKPAVD